MSRALKFASAAVVAALVETSVLWVLEHVVLLHYSIAVALAFTAGYLTLFAWIHILAPSGANPSLCTQFRTYGLFGIAVLLLAEVMFYVSVDLLGLNPIRVANTAALVAVVCWTALGWRFVGGDARQSLSGPANATKHE